MRRGDTVVELACGTGLNFPLLERAVGSEGRIVGVDLTDAMLDRARARVARKGWTNVELVQSDAARYRFPRGVNGILSTFAITFVPEYDRVIHTGSRALAPGGRFVILDLKKPEGWPMWLIRFAVFLTKPFGVTLELADRHPWESIERYFANVSFEELCVGAVYLSVGEAASAEGGRERA